MATTSTKFQLGTTLGRRGYEEEEEFQKTFTKKQREEKLASTLPYEGFDFWKCLPGFVGQCEQVTEDELKSAPQNIISSYFLSKSLCEDKCGSILPGNNPPKCPYSKEWCEASQLLEEWMSGKIRDVDEKIMELWEQREKEMSKLKELKRQRLMANKFAREKEIKERGDRYFSSQIIIPTNCFQGYEFRKRLGSGHVGVIYEACHMPVKEEKKQPYICDQVIKVEPITMAFPDTNDFGDTEIPIVSTVSSAQFLKEAETAQVMGELGIGPKVYKYWICKSDNIFKDEKKLEHTGWLGFVVMDKLDFTLYDFVNSSQSLPLPVTIDVLNKLEMIVKKKLTKMNEIGFFHTDITEKNIMVTLSPIGEIDAFIIDFEDLNTSSEHSLREMLEVTRRLFIRLNKLLSTLTNPSISI